VLDNALSASSYRDDSANYGADGAMWVARLGNMLGGGAWCAKFADQQQWVQVEFPPLVTFTIAGVQLQGHASSDSSVDRFMIRTRHKYQWNYVTVSQQSVAADDEGQQKLLRLTGQATDPHVFTSSEGTKTATHLLRQPVHAEAVRIHPTSWRGTHMCLRFEVLGCKKGHVSSSAASVDAAAAAAAAANSTASSSSSVDDLALPNPFPSQSMVVDLGADAAKVVKWYGLRFDKGLVPRSWELHGSNSSAFDDDTLVIVDRVELPPHPATGSEPFHGLELFFTNLNNNGSARASLPYRYFRFAFQAGFEDGANGYRVLEYHLYDTDVQDDEPALAPRAAAGEASYIASPTGAATSTKSCHELHWFDGFNSSDGVCAGSELKDGLKMQQLQDPSIDESNGWTLLFRQAKNSLHGAEYWLNRNTHDSTLDFYSIIENLDTRFQGDDGKYTFMMKWPKRRGRNWLSWKQTSNPYLNSLSFTRGVKGYEAVDVPSNPNGDFEIAFAGLEWSQYGALFDGNSGQSCGSSELSSSAPVPCNNWYYAIGTGLTGHTGPVGGANSIPGPDGRGEEMVELYVSQVLHQSCSGNVTYDQAERLCDSSGARLCTADELAADHAKGTGCGYDLAPVWSSSSSHQDLACGTDERAVMPGSSLVVYTTNVCVYTSSASNSRTSGSVTAELLVDGIWSDAVSVFTSVEASTTTCVDVAFSGSFPTDIKLRILSTDGWGYWKVTIDGVAAVQHPDGDSGYWFLDIGSTVGNPESIVLTVPSEAEGAEAAVRASSAGFLRKCVPTNATKAVARCCADVDCSAYEGGVNSTLLHSYTFPTRANFGSSSPDLVGSATARLNEGVQLTLGKATLDGDIGFLDLPIHATTNAGLPELTVEAWVQINGGPPNGYKKEALWGFSAGGGTPNNFMSLSPRGDAYTQHVRALSHHRNELVFTFQLNGDRASTPTSSYHLVAPNQLGSGACSESFSCPRLWTAIGCKCFSPARQSLTFVPSDKRSSTYGAMNCDYTTAQCGLEGGLLANQDELHDWLDAGGDRNGVEFGLTSTRRSNYGTSGDYHLTRHQTSDYGWNRGDCHHSNRYFVCVQDTGLAMTSDVTEVHHVVVTLQQHGAAVLYVNGVAVDDTERCFAAGRCPSATFDYTTADLGTLVKHQIGKSIDDTGCGTDCGSFYGSLHKFTLRSKALTACAVQALYERGLPTPDWSLVQVLDKRDACSASTDTCQNANFTGLRVASDTLRVGYQPKHLDYFFENNPGHGCKLHTVLQGPMNAIKMGPSALCPDEGCPPPPDSDALEARVGVWSDSTLWQAQTNKSYDMAVGGDPETDDTSLVEVEAGSRRLGEVGHKAVWKLVVMEGVPQDGDDAWIPPAWRVTLDIDTNELDSIMIEGTLKWGNGQGDISLTARMITLRGGYLLIGTRAHPFQDKATITLTGVDAWSASGLKQYVGFSKQIYDSGTIAIFGEKRVTWAKLEATALAGAQSITVNSPVDWRAGETIVITGGHGSTFEEAKVAFIDVDGLVVTLESPLARDHVSEILRVPSASGIELVDVRQAVGLLDRNVVIKARTGDNSKESYGWSLQTKCVPRYNGWTDAAGGYREEVTDMACSSGPRMHGVRLHKLAANLYQRPEFGIRANGMSLVGCTISDGQGKHSLNKGIYGIFPGGTWEIGTTILSGRTSLENNFIYRTYGITTTSTPALYRFKLDMKSGRGIAGSTYIGNLGIQTDMLLTGTGTQVRHNYVAHDAQGAGMVFHSDKLKTVGSRRNRRSICEENPSSKTSYNNTAMGSKIGIAVLSGCVRDSTVWDNGIGITMSASTKSGFIRTSFAENVVGLQTRGCYLMITCMKPIAVTQSFGRGLAVVASTFVGCRDDEGAVSASGDAIPSACAAPSRCKNIEMGIEHSGMDVVRTAFSRFGCRGHVIKSSQWAAPIAGSQPMKIRLINTTHVAANRFVSFHTGERTCGIGLGGTNGNPVACDSHSRPIVRDEDGSFFGAGAPGNAMSGMQAWPPSITTACKSEILAERQNCMWWQKVQPHIMEIAQPAMQWRQGIQRHSIDGVSCVDQPGWNGYKCNSNLKHVPVFIEDKVRRGRNAARRIGPIGFTQVCGYATGKNSRCIDTSAGAKDGGYSDFLAGISKAGPPDFEGHELHTNNFLPIGANMHKYRVDYTGTTPPNIRLSMPFADPDDSITVIVWYSSPMMLTLKNAQNQGLRVADRKTSVWPGRSDPSWFFDRLLNELHVTLTGKNSVTVHTRKVIQVAMTVAVTLEQFYGEGGEIHRVQFVRNVASVLMINPDRIRIVSIVPGNGRRRLLSFEKAHHARTDLRSIRGGTGAARSRRLAASTKVDFEVAEEDPCAGVECKNDGSCSQGLCACEAGFTGDTCEDEMSCGNGESCGADGSCDGETLVCACPSGFQEQKVLNENATRYGTDNKYLSKCSCVGSSCATADEPAEEASTDASTESSAFVSEEESLSQLQDLSATFNEKAAAGRVDVGYEMVGISVVTPPDLAESAIVSVPTGETQLIRLQGPEAWLSTLTDGEAVASFTLGFNGEISAPLPVHTDSLTADLLRRTLEDMATVGSVLVTQTKDIRHDVYLDPKSVVSNSTTAWAKQVELEYMVNFTLGGSPKNQGPQPLFEISFSQRETNFTNRAALAAGYKVEAGDGNWTIGREVDRVLAGSFATGTTIETQLVTLSVGTGTVSAPTVVAMEYTLDFGGQVTAPLRGNASAAEVRVALGALSTLEEAAVEVLREETTDGKARTWRVLLHRHGDYLCELSADGSTCSQSLPDLVYTVVTSATGTTLAVSRASQGTYPQIAFRDGAAEAALTSSSAFGEDYKGSSSALGFMNPTRNCGDGIRTTDEYCDDGNSDGGDGCSANCEVEEWRAFCNATFLGEISLCYPIHAACGDGSRQEGEGCDDGNWMAGDGCDALCGVESGYECVVLNPVMGQPYGNVSTCTIIAATAQDRTSISASSAAGVGAGVGVSLVLLAAAVALFVYRKRQLEKLNQHSGQGMKKAGALDAGTSFHAGGSAKKMKKQGLDAGQSFAIDGSSADAAKKIDFASASKRGVGAKAMRSDTLCDDDGEEIREVLPDNTH
jgi:cysteine-rich repeat protein